MAVAFRASASTTASGGTLTCNKPTGTASGDVLIAFQSAVAGALSDMGTPTGGATWSLLDSRAGDGGIWAGSKVWWKVAGGSEPSTYGFTQNSSGDGAVAVVALSGGSSGAPVFAQSGADTGGTTVPTPSVTPGGTADVELRWAVGVLEGGPVTWTPPATYTERVDVQPSGELMAATLATKTLSSGSASGIQNFTASDDLFAYQGFTVAVTTGIIEVSPGTVDAVADIPAPSVAAGATVSAATVLATADIPAPDLSTGSAVSPVTVDAVAVIPVPSITTGDVEVVGPDTVVAVADIPTPDVSTGQAIPAATVTALADIPTPDVSVGVTVGLATVVARAVIPTPAVMVPVLPGESITAAGQVEFGGVLWGAGTQFRVQEITGWESRPALDDQNENRPSRDGAWAGRKLAQQRLVSIRLRVDSFADPTEVDDALDELAWATRILDDDSQLSLVIRGYGDPLLAYGAVADYDVAWDEDYSVGAPVATVLIACPDPLKYSLTQQSVVVPAGGEETATNGGNKSAPTRIRIPGPAENPVLTSITMDRVLAFDLQIEGGQRLDIDTQRGTVKIGTADHRSALAALSVPVEDFVLQAGSNLLTFEVDSGGAAGAELLFRSARL